MFRYFPLAVKKFKFNHVQKRMCSEQVKETKKEKILDAALLFMITISGGIAGGIKGYQLTYHDDYHVAVIVTTAGVIGGLGFAVVGAITSPVWIPILIFISLDKMNRKR